LESPEFAGIKKALVSRHW